MATLIKVSTYLWVTCLFVLLANLAITVVLHLYQVPLLKKISQPLIISVFLCEISKLISLDYSYANFRIYSPQYYLCSLMVLVWVILDIFLFKSKEGGNENSENEDNENDENSTNNKKIDLNNFDFSTAFFAVIMWLTYMMNGMLYFLYMYYGYTGADADDYYSSYDYDEKSEWPKVQNFFYYLFRFATLQFVYGMFVLNQNVSKMFYFIYMIPQAVLWPLASIISFYVHQEGADKMLECHSVFCAFMAGTLLYLVFKDFYQYPEYIKDENKNKGFHILFLIIGVVWYQIVHQLKFLIN